VGGAAGRRRPSGSTLRYRRPVVAANRRLSAAGGGTRGSWASLCLSGARWPLSDPVTRKLDEALFNSLSVLVPGKRVEMVLRPWRLASDQVETGFVVSASDPARATAGRARR
jgi:hypothetical protein